MNFSDKVELACKVKAQTDKALLVDFGDKTEWIPQSQIDDDSEVWQNGQEGTIIISEWIAKQKGLI